MRKQAKITSKGRVTVLIEVRRLLGVRTGDRLLFEGNTKGIRIRPLRDLSALEKYRGIGNTGIPSGKKGINRWLREMRGHID